MLDPRISALEEDLDEVESSEEEDDEEEKVKLSEPSAQFKKLSVQVCNVSVLFFFLACSQRECRPLNLTGVVVTGTTTDLVVHHHLATDAAAHPDGWCCLSSRTRR